MKTLKTILATLAMLALAIGAYGASGTGKTYSWASLKADIKTYCDTLYRGLPLTKDYIWVGNASGVSAESNSFSSIITLAENKLLTGNSSNQAVPVTTYARVMLGAPDVVGSAATRDTTPTNITYGHALFADDVVTNNYIEWFITVPSDMDTSADPVATFWFSLGGADTADHDYIASMCVAAASAARDCSPGTPINLAYTADGAGASGDIEKTTATALTGWGAAVTAGSFWRIRITREGNDGTNDASTVDSYDHMFEIKYAVKPGS